MRVIEPSDNEWRRLKPDLLFQTRKDAVKKQRTSDRLLRRRNIRHSVRDSFMFNGTQDSGAKGVQLKRLHGVKKTLDKIIHCEAKFTHRFTLAMNYSDSV